jgi:hypothetical protein
MARSEQSTTSNNGEKGTIHNKQQWREVNNPQQATMARSEQSADNPRRPQVAITSLAVLSHALVSRVITRVQTSTVMKPCPTTQTGTTSLHHQHQVNSDREKDCRNKVMSINYSTCTPLVKCPGWRGPNNAPCRAFHTCGDQRTQREVTQAVR